MYYFLYTKYSSNKNISQEKVLQLPTCQRHGGQVYIFDILNQMFSNEGKAVALF